MMIVLSTESKDLFGDSSILGNGTACILTVLNVAKFPLKLVLTAAYLQPMS